MAKKSKIENGSASQSIRCAAITGAAFAVVPMPTSESSGSAGFVFASWPTAVRSPE